MDTLADTYYASSYRGEMGSAEFNKALQDWLNEQTGNLLADQAAEIELNPNTILALMYGVAGANNALKAMAKALATGVEKQLLRQALTKGTIYPIVKSVAKWFGVKMTKQVFAGFFKKAISVVGGVIGGGITYATFKPCCDKLKATLENTMLSNPNYNPAQTEDDLIISDDSVVIDVDTISIDDPK